MESQSREHGSWDSTNSHGSQVPTMPWMPTWQHFLEARRGSGHVLRVGLSKKRDPTLMQDQDANDAMDAYMATLFGGEAGLGVGAYVLMRVGSSKKRDPTLMHDQDATLMMINHVFMIS